MVADNANEKVIFVKYFFIFLYPISMSSNFACPFEFGISVQLGNSPIQFIRLCHFNYIMQIELLSNDVSPTYICKYHIDVFKS